MGFLLKGVGRWALWMALVGGTGAMASGQTEPPPGLSEADRLFGLSSFWAEARYRFVYFDQVPELDWDRAYRDFIPQVLAAPTTYEYYRVLQRFCALLEDGHTHIYYPPEVLEEELFFPEIVLREIGHRAIVAHMDESISTAIPVGSEIAAVDGVPVPEYLAQNVLPYVCNSTEHSRWVWAIQGNNFARVGLLAGRRGSQVALSVVDPSGGRHEVTATRVRPLADPTDVYTIRAIMGGQVRQVVEARPLEGDGLVYLAVHSFMPNVGVVDQVRAVLPDLARSRGIILDVRQNHGGSSWEARQVAALLTSEPLVGSRSRTRTLGEAWQHAEPDTVQPSTDHAWAMPVVVLTGPGTASGGEDFLVLLDSSPRFTRVGQATYGSTGQPVNLQLPGGGGAQICSKRDSYPDGREFVGVGVQPAVAAEPTVEGLREGRDVVLERGIEVLRELVEAGAR